MSANAFKLKEAPSHIQAMHAAILSRTGIDHAVNTLEVALNSAFGAIKSEKGVDLGVVLDSYEFTLDRDGNLLGLIGGDMDFNPTGIKAPALEGHEWDLVDKSEVSMNRNCLDEAINILVSDSNDSILFRNNYPEAVDKLISLLKKAQQSSRLVEQLLMVEKDSQKLFTKSSLALAWAQGYRAGIDDERESEANIGAAGFDMKVEPNRQNPYRLGL